MDEAVVVVVAEDVAVQVDDVAKHIMEVANPITEAEAEAEAGAEEGVVPVVGKGNRMFNATTAEFEAHNLLQVVATRCEYYVLHLDMTAHNRSTSKL